MKCVRLFNGSMVFVIIGLVVVAKSAKSPKDGLNYKLPFVTLFNDENHRGNYYHHYLKKECTNLPAMYDDWASSINVYDRCVYLCENKDCQGACERIHGSSSKGIDRLGSVGLNDKVSSIKFCYTFAERGNRN